MRELNQHVVACQLKIHPDADGGVGQAASVRGCGIRQGSAAHGKAHGRAAGGRERGRVPAAASPVLNGFEAQRESCAGSGHGRAIAHEVDGGGGKAAAYAHGGNSNGKGLTRGVVRYVQIAEPRQRTLWPNPKLKKKVALIAKPPSPK